ncbi:MAG: AAA family ATPase [Candidatus Omnitrophica bacterium]|nr:AAA family ATPase [Candidatus Omnitrophota bacterium]
MGYIIAVAGKGGTGKTTIASLLVRLLKDAGKTSIIAIDADPNSNLGDALGVEVKESIGSILDDVAKDPRQIPAGTTKDRFLEYRIQDSVVEADGFDLLSMGRPEGPGCYCFVNNLLRAMIARLASAYKYVIIDNEAGFEHLSRRTMRSADVLLIVSDPSSAGLRAAARIDKLSRELDIAIKRRVLVINRVSGSTADTGIIQKSGIEMLGSIADDKAVNDISVSGGSAFSLSGASPAYRQLKKIGEKIWA